MSTGISGSMLWWGALVGLALAETENFWAVTFSVGLRYGPVEVFHSRALTLLHFYSCFLPPFPPSYALGIYDVILLS